MKLFCSFFLCFFGQKSDLSARFVQTRDACPYNFRRKTKKYFTPDDFRRNFASSKGKKRQKQQITINHKLK